MITGVDSYLGYKKVRGLHKTPHKGEMPTLRGIILWLSRFFVRADLVCINKINKTPETMRLEEMREGFWNCAAAFLRQEPIAGPKGVCIYAPGRVAGQERADNGGDCAWSEGARTGGREGLEEKMLMNEEIRPFALRLSCSCCRANVNEVTQLCVYRSTQPCVEYDVPQLCAYNVYEPSCATHTWILLSLRRVVLMHVI